MLRDNFAGLIELFSVQQMAHGLLPTTLIRKVSGATRMFGGHAGETDLSAEPATKKALEEWVESILFSATIAGDSHKHVAPNQRRQCG